MTYKVCIRAFSLIEMMISLVIGAFLMMGAYQFVTRSTQSTTETIKDASFARQMTLAKESLTNYFDAIGYNPKMEIYAVAKQSSDTSLPSTRRIGITKFFSSFIDYTADLDRDGSISATTEQFRIVWKKSDGTVMAFQSAYGAQPCTPGTGNGMPTSGTLYLESGPKSDGTYETQTPIAEKVHCFEIQYSCEVNAVDGAGSDVDPNLGEPGEDECKGPLAGKKLQDQPKWKRWWLTKTERPGNGTFDPDVHAVALPGDGPVYSSNPHPMVDYYRFIRTKIDMLKVGMVLEGPCNPPQKELNPLTNNYCPTARIEFEKILNPPWRANYIAACAGINCPSTNPGVLDQNPTGGDEVALSYPNPMEDGNVGLPAPPSIPGDSGTAPTPSATYPPSGGGGGSSSPILMMKGGSTSGSTGHSSGT